MLQMQIVGGFQRANGAILIAPEGDPLSEFQTVYSVGLRLAFDWRHYW